MAPSNGDWPIIAARANWDEGTSVRGDGDFKYWADGKSRGDKYKHFGGTTGSVSIVAGVCGLILSVNPYLTSKEVKEILILTADKIGDPSEYINGHSLKYGFGRVNALNAVKEAQKRLNKKLIKNTKVVKDSINLELNAPEITQNLLTNHNRPALRNASFYSIREVKGIVAHWSANPGWGADAIANRNYFNTTPRKSSVHYEIDDHSIIQCIPDNEVAFHVGAKTYKPIGEGLREGLLTPNFFTVGFEMCVNIDGDWDLTYKKSVELAAYLIYKHQLTINELYRHYDITGKLCPRMMVEEKEWKQFKNDVSIEFQDKWKKK